MPLTPGQALAQRQLEEIQGAMDGGLELLSYESPPDEGKSAKATLSLPCWDMPRTQDGLLLRDRERVLVFIPDEFPFIPPRAWVRHSRFADFPHVQWSHHLCLYQSVATEWDASDGMYGFLARLERWFRLAAINQLDPIGAPLHPPVAYPQVNKIVIPRANTPRVGEEPWAGLAHLEVISERRVDVVGWSGLLDEVVPETVGAAVLLPAELPFEYPKKAKDLLDHLERQGVSRARVLLTLAIAARRNREGEPLYVLLGTPMRGIRGYGRLKQHLTAWYIEPKMARGLRLTLKAFHEDEEIRAIGQELEELMADWVEMVDVSWTSVREDRPEVVVRRDQHSPMAWFLGKTVAVWGCGALGAAIAEYLLRAHVKSLILHDHGVVAPGVLARQPYRDLDIGFPKAEVLAKRLQNLLAEDVDIRAVTGNLLNDPLDADDWTEEADIVIDASASRAVIDKLESVRRRGTKAVPVVTMAIDHRAQRGIVVLAAADHTGGPVDVLRSAKAEACSRAELRHFADAFWPDEPTGEVFQPEPGCSAATFIGSAADSAALSAAMLNLVADELARSEGFRSGFAHLMSQPHVRVPNWNLRQASMSWPRDLTTTDPDSNFEIRISEAAWRDILGWIERSRRLNGFKIETGGILFGERDDAAGVIWVREVMGPPPDSEASPDLFLCGVQGVLEANDEKRNRSRRSNQYIGMWHTHPGSDPVPSQRDLEGMQRLVQAEQPSTPKPLLLIVRPEVSGAPPNFGARIFARQNFEDSMESGPTNTYFIQEAPRHEPPRRDVGIALSGGGSRAVAFHLGCLRALHDRGILERTQVISAVSGGAVLAALYAYTEGAFEEFDRAVVDLLRKGLVGSILKEMLFAPRLLLRFPEMVLSGFMATGASALRLQPPLQRRFSRTTAFERALRRRAFHDIRLTDPRRGNIDVVLNACELRTGTAFRFGSRESGNWRFGRLRDNSVPIAHAVAASAAYPALLPAVDERLDLVDKKGNKSSERLILTDGGIYDNLAVSCMEPGRSPELTYNTFNPEFLVCCDAGHGQLHGHRLPYWWPARMKRSFESTFRKASDATRSRLHEHAAYGRLRGFVLPYLGQQDGRLPYLPPDLVPRDAVCNYPTDFSPMAPDMIECLTLRGEQLTRLLIPRYCPEL